MNKRFISREDKSYLYQDILAMATHIEEQWPGAAEIQAVSAANIEAMETDAGFPMPESFKAFWLKKGYFYFDKDDFTCVIYAYNTEGPAANSFYGILSFFLNLFRRESLLVESEMDYFSQCFWQEGLIIDGDESWFFISDPLGRQYCIHFNEHFRNINEATLAEALAPLMAVKEWLALFITIKEERALLPDEAKEDTGPEKEDNEEQETLAFLQKHQLQELSYGEVLARLGVDTLFDYWDDNSGEDLDYSITEFESEEEYFEENSRIYYCDGDLEIDGNLEIPHRYFDLLVVRGNMTVRGRVFSLDGSGTPYYVTGDTTIDYLQLGYFQKTCGEESVRYVASAWASDDESVCSLPYRKVNAPFFFSWFYDLNCFEFAPQTLITALYNEDRLSAYATDNALLAWHDYAYAFRAEFYAPITETHHDFLSVHISAVYEALKNNQPILLDGVTAEGIKLNREGMRLKKEADIPAAYLCFKAAISASPNYYLPYYNAGKCLFEQKAFSQAMTTFSQGIPYTPEKVKYEYACMEYAALSAVRKGEYDQAIEWANMALGKDESANFVLRVIGEALIFQKRLGEARTYLEKSINIKSAFTNNWLLGLIYHLEGQQAKADALYQTAQQKNGLAKPYYQHTDLTYFYGEPVTVDWDSKRPVIKTKDQAYWDEYFAGALSQYGPDLYKRIRQFPDEWLSGKITTIPTYHRTGKMLQALLEHQTDGEYDVDGNMVRFFDQEHLTAAMILLAVKREQPCYYSNIPTALLSEQVFEIHPQGIDLSYVAPELKTYERCFRAVSTSQYNYHHVPEPFKDERMNIALIAGGGLNNHASKELPRKYHSSEYIKQAIDLGIRVIENIPVRLVDTAVYQYAIEKYGQEPEWPFIVERYDRERWKFGSPSDVERMGKDIRKHGIGIFNHVDAAYIDQHSYQYYKKHLGHLPEFEQKVKTFGWDGRSGITDKDNKEFDYDTFSKVWACFWDEDFIIKAITSNSKESSERIYDLPQQYLTQKICDIAVARNSYDFQFVPKAFITPKMCETACSLDYGSALEFVPLDLRTEKVCELALSRDAENIKFVPLQLRSVERCARVILRAVELDKYVPYEHYSSVYKMLFDKHKSKLYHDYLLLKWGVGLIIDKKYPEARKKLMEVEKAKEARTSFLHQALYYIGWSYQLEGDTDNAREYWRKAQDLAKAEKIETEDWLKFAYSDFQLPAVPDVFALSQEAFDDQMRQASLLVQSKDYTEAIELLSEAEKMLQDAQCSEMRLWAYVWDHQRYALYEAGRKEASLALCEQTIATLSKITLWDYLEEFNPIRAALRSAHNSLAYRCYDTAEDLKMVEEGLKHIKTIMKTVAPIEGKDVLHPFYETHALLLEKAMSFDAAYEKDLQKVMDKIRKLKLGEKGILSKEFSERLM